MRLKRSGQKHDQKLIELCFQFQAKTKIGLVTHPPLGFLCYIGVHTQKNERKEGEKEGEPKKSEELDRDQESCPSMCNYCYNVKRGARGSEDMQRISWT